MKITLKTTNVLLVGAFKKYGSKQALVAKLRSAGVPSISTTRLFDHTNLVVEGRAQKTWAPNKHVLAAGARQIPVVGEEELQVLLETGELELEVEGGEAEVSDQIAEARSALALGPCSEAWSRIVSLVDACEPSRLEELVSYLEPQLMRWEVPTYARWVVADDDPIRGRVKDDFFRWMRRGELCVAPPHWVMDAVTRDSPRLRLVRRLSLLTLDLNNAKTLAILGRESLVNLRRLDLSEVKIGKTFWKKGMELPSMQGVEALSTERAQVDHVAALGAVSELPALKKIALQKFGWGYLDGAGIGALLGSPMSANVEVLSLDTIDAVGGARVAIEGGALPKLERIEISCYELARPLEALIAQGARVFERAKSVALIAADEHTRPAFSRISVLDYSGIGELDLSGITAEQRLLGREDRIEEMRQEALAALPGSRLVETVGSLRLGELSSPELLEKLKDIKILD